MQVELAIVTGLVFAAGVYMVLRRSLIKLVIGLVLLSHAANLCIFTSAEILRGIPPIVEKGQLAPTQPVADPLPEALILTAIVISFGVTAFVLVLFQCAYGRLGETDVDTMRATDETI